MLQLNTPYPLADQCLHRNDYRGRRKGYKNFDPTSRLACTYRIECLTTGFKYVGVTGDFITRWWTHLNKLRRCSWQTNLYMQMDFDTFGEDDFTITIIEWVDVVDAPNMLAAEERAGAGIGIEHLYNVYLGHTAMRTKLRESSGYMPRNPKGAQTEASWRACPKMVF